MVTVAERSTPLLELIRREADAAGDGAYAEVVCSVPFSHYERRVEELAFTRLGRVLDVGCGFGHWSIALAARNDEVVAIDRSPTRARIARQAASAAGADNVHVDLGDASELPYPAESFDGVFCYGVFMFLDRRKALAEFWRVLSPGGRLYVCTNAAGWWLRLWLQSLRNPAVRKPAFSGWAKGRGGAPPHSLSRRRTRRLLSGGCWSNVETAFEGHLGAPAAQPPASVYPGRWLGLDCVVEFAATKVGGASGSREEAAPEIERAVEQTARRQTYDYVSPLARHPQPRPALDLVNNCDPAVVARARLMADAVDRLDVLHGLYARLVAEATTDAERVVACLTFAQKHFFHHFAGQPMVDGTAVLDPVASLLVGHGRCGSSARFLVDLFECNGVPARLVAGACHTAAEVSCEGRWVLADASLYPPGVVPRDRAGRLLALEDAAQEPDLLNRPPSYVNYHAEYVDAFLSRYPETRDAIGVWLEAPLLPSAAYFGGEFSRGSGRVAGAVERLRKTGEPATWASDANFGWGGLTGQTLAGPVCPTEQRPGQVKGLSVGGGLVSWERPSALGSAEQVRYRVLCSEQSRGWSYDALPVGCDFAVPGPALYVDECALSFERLPVGTAFVTVVAENPAWRGREIFYLPSPELALA